MDFRRAKRVFRGRSRKIQASTGPMIEVLERRDCPATIGIHGSKEVGEADSAAKTLRVRLNEPATQPVTVSYFIQGSASLGQDYRLTIGSRPLATTGTITFQPGQTVQKIAVEITNDQLREGTEGFSVTLFNPRNATLRAAKSASVTILDDDAYTASITGVDRLAEGQSGQYTLTLSAPATKAETFYVNTVDGLATSGTDYRPLTSLPVVFMPGESAKTFSINTVRDRRIETDEYFFLKATPTANSVFPAVDPFGVTIAGIGPAPLPTVSISDASTDEGNTGKVALTFTIDLSTVYGSPVTVRYATSNGTATTMNDDYDAASGVAVIPAGLTSTTVTVWVNGDTVAESDETFSVIISAPTNATLGTSTAIGTIINDDSAFQIDVIFADTAMTAAQQAAFRQAASRWSQIITADLPDVTTNGRVIDDLEITASARVIDGPFGILGQARPGLLRAGGSQLPYTGSMEFDTADLAWMESNGTLFDVILHEMGHVLGIGSLWNPRNLLTNIDTDPIYVGVNGLREYQGLAGDSTLAGVPVEDLGGPGTALAHWRERVFGNELMTGNAERPGIAMPISRMTVGALEDLGYGVSYAAADPFTLPFGATSPASAIADGLTGSDGMTLLRASVPDTVFAAMATVSLDASHGTARQRAFATVLPA